MTSLAQLHQAVQSALVSKRLGQPLFVRYHLHGLPEFEGGSLPKLAKIATIVGQWIGQPAEKLYQLSSAAKRETAQWTLTLRYPNGATAVVSEVHGAGRAVRELGVGLMVLGSKGALYHSFDAGTLHIWETMTPSLERRGSGEILAAIENTREKEINPVTVEKPRKSPPPPEPRREEEKPRYGVLLITGSHTHQAGYAAAFAADPRCKLIALTDEKDVDARRRRLNERLARELGIPYIADLNEALQRDDVQIVSLCAEPERRGRIALLCAKAGKHLYLDKSLVPRLAEADALREAVARAKVKSHMFSFISMPWAAEAKKIVADGKLGTLLAIHADAFFAKRRPGTAKLGTPRKEENQPRR